MNYGLYLSATGVLTNSYRQDVIANNLANAETVGFKKDLALFQQRLTESQERRLAGGQSNPMLEKLGGGMLASPTAMDLSQGELEPSDSPLDLAIMGRGYFAVSDGKQTRLTRDGRFMIDRKGQLILGNAQGQRVLDVKGKPIVLDPTAKTEIGEDGQITQNDVPMARVGVVGVPNEHLLIKQGGGLMSYPDTKKLTASSSTLKSHFVERSNVEPTTELAGLMDTQRQLEANANMIRYQDQMLAKLVNEVGKIS